MNAFVAGDAERLVAEFAGSCARMAAAVDAGRIDDVLTELPVQDALRHALGPMLAALAATGSVPAPAVPSAAPDTAPDAALDTAPAAGAGPVAGSARERIALLLQQALTSGRAAEAGLRQSRNELRDRLSVVRRSASSTAGYGTVDLPVSSGFSSRG